MKTTKAVLGILTLTMALVVQVQAQSFLTNGLVAYYPFNGNANDASGSGNNGTPQNVTYEQVSGRLAAKFTGAPNSAVTVPNSPSLSMTNAVTVSVWFNNFGPINGPEWILDKAWKQPVSGEWFYRAWSMWYSGGGVAIFEGRTNTAPALTSVGARSVGYNQWYHMVGIADGATGAWRTYTNGVLAEEKIFAPFTLSTGPYPLVIGAPVAQTDGAQTGLNGAINDVRIYNRALSAAEVQQ
jgi:hypothetical protein